MNVLSNYDIEARIINSFEPIESVHMFSDELKWYFDGIDPSNPSKRITQVTEGLIGSHDSSDAIKRVCETMQSHEMDDFYRGLCERSLRLLISFEHYKTQVKQYRAKEYPHKDTLDVQLITVSDKSTIIIYHKSLLNGFMKTDLYNVQLSHTLESTLQEVTKGFEPIN